MGLTLLSITLLVVAAVALIITLFFLKKVIVTGRKLGQLTKGHTRNSLTTVHKKYVDCFGIALLVTVVIVEGMVRAQGGRLGNPVLFAVHGVFVLTFIVNGLRMRFKWTGLVDPEKHRRLAAWTLNSFWCALGTGAVLIIQLVLQMTQIFPSN